MVGVIYTMELSKHHKIRAFPLKSGLLNIHQRITVYVYVCVSLK